MLTYCKDPAELMPEFGDKSDSAIAEILDHPAIKAAGVIAMIDTETKRNPTAQLLNYLRGRMINTNDLDFIYKEFYGWTLDKKSAETIATNVIMQGKHVSGNARDIYLSKDGKTPWKSAPENLWTIIGIIVRSHGLTWGGDWKQYGLYEPWHWETK